MKKYLLGFLAICLFISFSAYMPIKSMKLKNSPEKTTANAAPRTVTIEESLYWYPVQSSGAIDHNQLINQTTMTKTELRSASLIPCPEVPGTDCIRGFVDLQNSDVFDQGVDATEKAE